MKIRFKKIDIHEWHEKFAWYPVSVQDVDDKYTIVWFEKYMRKRYRSGEWHQFSKKEYFKRKLNGEFEKPKPYSSGVDASPPIGITAHYPPLTKRKLLVNDISVKEEMIEQIKQQIDERHNQ